jgi:hypothetical protein
MILDMNNIITIEDTTNEVYYINPRNVAYIKEKKNQFQSTSKMSSWKISLVNGESIITRNEDGVKRLISAYTNQAYYEENI